MGEFYAKSIRRFVLNSPQSTRLTFVVQGFIFRKRYVHVRILSSCQKRRFMTFSTVLPDTRNFPIRVFHMFSVVVVS